ncbi:myosin heavy chain kinase [Seminavis robusta]|uniref:Myosin heavy chain kinase n=1 Tax=Seminavis robusta TaxID=568900 RepID=A0A9N8HCC3_9STRA|nr:myosin heavy chain kinase [Seminavis robusta]|eukprot:Sro402_g135520.1 myosin heavy chain kinase (666) ;mRNA; r:60161-62228
MYANRQTSLITILSSEHGRMRRDQRDIDKRDLQKALKHGTRSCVWGGRYKVEHDGIVFITDSTLRKEITAYPAPLANAPEDRETQEMHRKAKEVLSLKPELCKSHTVLVVDVSGSMLTHDINLHRDRQTAAYTNVALEFVAEQLFNGTANNSDVVSLVEFSSSARVVFKREPARWVLYNKVLNRRDSRPFVDRERHRMRDSSFFQGDSNYLPALKMAEELLAIDFHEDCALSIMFLSDGAPTDAQTNGLTPLAAERQTCARMASIAAKFRENLCIQTIGFGDQFRDFSVLQKMANAAKVSSPETKSDFVYCDKFSHALGSAVSSLVTSLTETRTSLMLGRASKYTKREVASEGDQPGFEDWKFYKIHKHFAAYDPKIKRFLPSSSLPAGSWRKENNAEFNSLVPSPPPFIGISTRKCGEGAERLAFRSFLAQRESHRSFVLGAMIAKETNAVERIQENIEFHRTFFETQNLASHLAKEFNKRLKALPNYDATRTPKIIFLDCSVLVLSDPSAPRGLRGILVEKKLDTDGYEWQKWNDNAGAVDGRVAHIPIDVDHEMAVLRGETSPLGAIAEGDSDEDSEDEDSCDGLEDPFGPAVADGHQSDVKPSDFLQAFTHFSYLFTNKKVMVCDLQGIYNEGMVPPTFELTDPAIHYKSSRREIVFGRTG